jgi:hypothetical protein
VPYHYFRAISKVALPVGFVVVHWLKELLLQAQMLVGDSGALYRHVIPDVNIGICSTIYIWSDTYLKLEKWQLILSLFMGARVYYLVLFF